MKFEHFLKNFRDFFMISMRYFIVFENFFGDVHLFPQYFDNFF